MDAQEIEREGYRKGDNRAEQPFEGIVGESSPLRDALDEVEVIASINLRGNSSVRRQRFA